VLFYPFLSNASQSDVLVQLFLKGGQGDPVLLEILFEFNVE